MNNKEHGAFGAGLLGFALGALVGAMLSPRSGAENREKVANWMTNLSEDLNKRVHETKDLTAEKYNSLVEDVAYKYRKMRGIQQDELNDFVSDLKMRWDRIRDRWNNDDPKPPLY